MKNFFDRLAQSFSTKDLLDTLPVIRVVLLLIVSLSLLVMGLTGIGGGGIWEPVLGPTINNSDVVITRLVGIVTTVGVLLLGYRILDTGLLKIEKGHQVAEAVASVLTFAEEALNLFVPKQDTADSENPEAEKPATDAAADLAAEVAEEFKKRREDEAAGKALDPTKAAKKNDRVFDKN